MGHRSLKRADAVSSHACAASSRVARAAKRNQLMLRHRRLRRTSSPKPYPIALQPRSESAPGVCAQSDAAMVASTSRHSNCRSPRSNTGRPCGATVARHPQLVASPHAPAAAWGLVLEQLDQNHGTGAAIQVLPTTHGGLATHMPSWFAAATLPATLGTLGADACTRWSGGGSGRLFTVTSHSLPDRLSSMWQPTTRYQPVVGSLWPVCLGVCCSQYAPDALPSPRGNQVGTLGPRTTSSGATGQCDLTLLVRESDESTPARQCATRSYVRHRERATNSLTDVLVSTGVQIEEDSLHLNICGERMSRDGGQRLTAGTDPVGPSDRNAITFMPHSLIHSEAMI